MQIVSLGRQFALNVKSYFRAKIKKNIINLSSAEFVRNTVSVDGSGYTPRRHSYFGHFYKKKSTFRTFFFSFVPLHYENTPIQIY